MDSDLWRLDPRPSEQAMEVLVDFECAGVSECLVWTRGKDRREGRVEYGTVLANVQPN